MGTNQLGKNIQHLRKIHGETLDQLGKKIGYAKNTVKGYENGSRNPSPETLQAIAWHYDQTVDDLLNSDLSGLEEMGNPRATQKSLIRLTSELLPLFCRSENLKNENFRNAYSLLKYTEICTNLSSLRSSLHESLQRFNAAFEETGDFEAVANGLRSALLLWLFLLNDETILKSQELLSKTEIDINELVELVKQDFHEESTQRSQFLKSYDDKIYQMIAVLKSDTKWADLGDYYLSLRFLYNIVDNGRSKELNSLIGTELLGALVLIENPYATSFVALGYNIWNPSE